MDFTLFWSVFVVLGIIYFAIGMYASRHVATEEEYFLAGRKFGFTTVTLTLIATQLGAGMVLGTSDEAYRVGFYGLLYNVGICFGFILLGCGFASKLRGFNISTTAELFELKYNSVALRRLASLLSILTLGGILAGQILASRKLMGTFTDEYQWLITGFWLLVIFYTMFGGLKAVVATDIFQVILIMLIFGGVFTYTLMQEGFTADHANRLIEAQNTHFSAKDMGFGRLLGFLLMPMLFSLIEQDLAQRFFSAKTKRTAMMAAFIAGLTIILFSCVPVFFGMHAKLLGLVVAPGASPLIAVIKHLTNDIALVLVVCALIAAISSTADSLLCAIGSNIIYDFNLTSNAPSEQSAAILLSRAVTLVVGVGALIMAYFFDNVLDILVQSYELSVSCLFIPIVMCFFKTRLFTKAAAFAVATGLVGFVLFRILPPPFPREVGALVFSLLGYIAGELWAKSETQSV